MSSEKPDSTPEAAVGKCDTDGCHREAVMTHTYTPDGAESTEPVSRQMCLPCRRVLEYSRAVPIGDESDEWHDKAALKEYLEATNAR